ALDTQRAVLDGPRPLAMSALRAGFLYSRRHTVQNQARTSPSQSSTPIHPRVETIPPVPSAPCSHSNGAPSGSCPSWHGGQHVLRFLIFYSSVTGTPMALPRCTATFATFPRCLKSRHYVLPRR